MKSLVLEIYFVTTMTMRINIWDINFQKRKRTYQYNAKYRNGRELFRGANASVDSKLRRPTMEKDSDNVYRVKVEEYKDE